MKTNMFMSHSVHHLYHHMGTLLRLILHVHDEYISKHNHRQYKKLQIHLSAAQGVSMCELDDTALALNSTLRRWQ